MTGLGVGVSGAVAAWGDAQRNLTDPNANDVVTQANRAMCDALATGPGNFAAQWSTAAGAGSLFCQPYYQQNGDVGPTQQSPFTGGQCAGTRYRVGASGTNSSGNPFNSTNSTLWGPISNFKIETPSPTSWSWTASGFSHPIGNPSRQPLQTGNQGARQADSPVNRVGPEPQSGGANNCGDPPAELVPDPSYSRPRTPQNPGTVNIGGKQLNVSFSEEKTDIDGSLYVDVGIGDISIAIAVDGSQPNLPSPPEPPAKEGEPTEPGTPSGEVPDNLPPEEEEQGFETIGYRFDLLGIQAFDSRIPGTNPVMFATTVGNLILKLKSESDQEFWSEPIRILSERGSIVRQDPSLKVVGIRYNHLPTFGGIRLTPLRARRRQ